MKWRITKPTWIPGEFGTLAELKELIEKAYREPQYSDLYIELAQSDYTNNTYTLDEMRAWLRDFTMRFDYHFEKVS